MAQTPQPAPQPASFKKGQLTLWFSVAFVALVIWQLPTVMVIFFGLLPTIVSGIIDRTPKKHAAFCVGGINLCGVFPYMMEMWTGDNSMDGAMRILTDVFSLVIMYGAAAFGWMIYQSLPPIVATFLTVIAQSRVSSLRSTQRQLIEEWGDDVATPQEVLDMRDQFGEEAAPEPAPTPEPVSSGGTDTAALLDGIDNLLAGTAGPPDLPTTPQAPPPQEPEAPQAPPADTPANGTPPTTTPKTA